MAAQAIGRATVLRDAPSLLVAVGAGFFMLSDSLLATNRFVMPLPMAQVWVLATYYAAQALIVSGWLASKASVPAAAVQRTGAAGEEGRTHMARDRAPNVAPGTASRSS